MCAQGPFAASLSLVVLAPVLIAAGCYLLIGRLIQTVLPSSTGYRVFGVHGRKITRIFVASDVLTFLIQCAGSGVASSVEWVGSTAQVGVYILIGGLALQALCFIFFLSIFTRFVVLATKKGLVAEDAPQGWKKVVLAVYVASFMILVSPLPLCDVVLVGAVGADRYIDPVHLSHLRICRGDRGVFVQA